MLGNSDYCYPLSVMDYASCYLICCEAQAFTVFEQLFREYGCQAQSAPTIASPLRAPMRSMVYIASVWWLRLGIGIKRIKSGNPQQNGRHERMYLTLKQAMPKPPAKRLLQQQDKFEDFIHSYNYERPNQSANTTNYLI